VRQPWAMSPETVFPKADFRLCRHFRYFTRSYDVGVGVLQVAAQCSLSLCNRPKVRISQRGNVSGLSV
jgi:hypothetical protein